MRLVLLTLLLTPLTAHAAEAVAWVVANWVLVAQVVITVGTAVYGSAQQRKAARQAKNDYNASLQDRTVTRIASEAPHVYVYGRAKVGSAIVAMFTSGDKDQYKHLVCVHAAHECDGIEAIYVAGKKLENLDANGFPTTGPFVKTRTEWINGEAVSGQTFTLSQAPLDGATWLHLAFGLEVSNDDGGDVYRPPTVPEAVPARIVSVVGQVVTLDADYGQIFVSYPYVVSESVVRVKTHLGAPSDPADAQLIAELPDKWTSAHVLRGFCYTYVRLDVNEAEFQGGPPSVEVVMRGKKLYDFRAGITAWSDNVALGAYDYLTSELCGVDPDDLPEAQFIAAANACDVVDPANPAGGKRYTLNGTVTSDQPQTGVLEKMAQAMAGGIVSTTWDIWAGTYVAPVMALDQSDIIGQIAVTPGISDADLYNGVRGQFISAETSYVATDFEPYQNGTYLAADGRELWTNIDFPFTDGTQRVHNLARIFTEDQRNGYTVKAEYSLKAWKLKVGQRITLTSTFFGWSAKVFRVMDKKFAPNAAVELTLKEDTAEIWDYADAVTVDATPNTNLPDPFAIEKIGSVTCESGTNALLQMADGTISSGIIVSWPAARSQAVSINGKIEIRYLRIGGAMWQWVEASGSDTQARIGPVQDGAQYIVAARCWNPYLNVRSDWTYAQVHTVIGKSEPPTAPAAVAATPDKVIFTGSPDLDMDGYRIRYNTGTNTNPSVATLLHNEETLVPGSPWPMPIRLYGVNTILVTAVDRSGNESVAAYDTQDFGIPDAANIAHVTDYAATGFTGFVTNGTVTGTDLEADADPAADFYGSGSGVDIYYRDGAEDIYGGSQYLEMTYIATYASPYNGGTILLDHSIVGARATIEYRVDGGDGDIYSGDNIYSGESIYGAEQNWQPWPGAIYPTVAWRGYQFRVTTDAGSAQGIIDAFAVRTEMPTISQTFGRVMINAAGTILAPSAGLPAVDWIAIEDVQITPLADSGGAIAGRVKSLDPAIGVEAELINELAATVTGPAFVRISGY
jgi:hypothetical protein